jgi:DNA-binding SARP family transcriptional activator
MPDFTVSPITVPMTIPAPDPVLICLFGSFRLFRHGVMVPVRNGSKTEALLSCLALRQGHRLPRDTLLDALWPEVDLSRAAQSLTTLVYAIRRAVGSALAGAPPVLYSSGGYELNSQAGVAVDVARFDALAAAGERSQRLGDHTGAIRSWGQAVELYRGDISSEADVYAIIERERLRALHLTLLAHLADHYLAVDEHQQALRYACRLLQHDPCREDAHRLVMTCHVRVGERAQALRQYEVCRQILEREFRAPPEPSTAALFARVRFDPASV